MTLTTINDPPADGSFTPLEVHQSQTPTTFYDEKPVQHFWAASVIAQTSPSEASKLPFYSPNATYEDSVARSTVDVWVTSESVLP
jgi:nucleotide-sensitive chloride channel 1A